LTLFRQQKYRSNAETYVMPVTCWEPPLVVAGGLVGIIANS